MAKGGAKMAKLLPIIPPGDGFNLYNRLRYLLAGIARCLTFYDKELLEAVNSASCRAFAARATEHYFHKSRFAAIYGDMMLMFQCLTVMAPILQRQLNSMGFDWHAGTILTWFRVNTAHSVRKYFYGCDEHPRVPDPLLLRSNLHHLGIYDQKFCELLEMIYRAYYGRRTVSGKLANVLFDPIMFCKLGDIKTLRVGNRIFRLEKKPFPGSIDLRSAQAVVFGYRIQRIEWEERVPLAKGELPKTRKKDAVKTKMVTRGMLEITIAEEHFSTFKNHVKTVLHSGLSLKYKIVILDRHVGAFVMSIRHARNSFEQIVELKRWLHHRLEPLRIEADKKARVKPDPLYDVLHRLSDIMVNKYLMLSNYQRYFRRPNFFYDPLEHDELTLLRFFSPYREGGE